MRPEVLYAISDIQSRIKKLREDLGFPEYPPVKAIETSYEAPKKTTTADDLRNKLKSRK